ncbi:hypothetical protein AB0L25_38905 [Spirillospora sp. NPDC052242]
MDEVDTHTDEDIERLAGGLYRQARDLNQSVEGRSGPTRPEVLYSVLGNLAQAAFGMARTAEQIDAVLDRELAAGRLGHDRGLDPTPVVVQAHDALARAYEQAAELGESFRRAQGALTAVHGATDSADTLDKREVAAADQTAPELEPAKNDFPTSIKEALAGQAKAEPPAAQRPSSPHPSRPRREP